MFFFVYAAIYLQRHAGCSWFDIMSHRSVQREVRTAFAAGWEKGASAVIPSSLAASESLWRQPAAAARKSCQMVREVMPTFALRHAGGSWLDVLSHPAFRFKPSELPLMRAATVKEAAAAHPRVPMACRPYLHNPHQQQQRSMGPHLPSALARTGAAAGAATAGGIVGNVGSGGLYGARGAGVLDAMSMSVVAASFVSSSGALRHAGCTWFEVARHAAFHACVRSRVVSSGYAMYLATFVEQPFTTALVTSVFKCVTSDIAVQYFIEGREELDLKRVMCFATLGLTYVGAFQYGLYNNLMKPLGGVLTRRFGTGASVGTMVAIDTFLVCPFVYLPAFFGLKMWANGECTLAETPAKIAAKLRGTGVGGGGRDGGGRDGDETLSNGKEGMGMLTLIALWAYWMPAQAINFWMVPRHLTIPFMNLLGFGWNGIMSAMNGADDRVAQETTNGVDERRAMAVAAVAADAAAAAAASSEGARLVESESRDCLRDERCVKAISMASMDALAIARVGVGATQQMAMAK